MLDVLKVGDSGSGVCHSHESPVGVTGTIVTGQDGFMVTPIGELLATDGQVVSLTCGHTGTLVATVSDITADGIPVGRSGDAWINGTGVTTGTITNTSGGVTEG